MKTTLATIAGAFALGVSVVGADSIAICTGLTYADGYLYCRKNSNGDCLPDLGDFPVEVSFPLYMHAVDSTTQAMQYSLAQSTGSHTYTIHDRVLTIDTSSGAVEPVEFKQLAAIQATQTSLYWFNAYGIILWSPTTNVADGTPKAHSGQVSGSGFQMIEVPGRPGVFRQHWNQTLFEAMRDGTVMGQGNFGSYCYSDYNPVIVQG
ncbi:hypothetical protein GQ53DRAFT_835633 [Thozetella sp. PMI_491]|nr:hypothetical protein GQ53DRAFT_835633 [Thozetella sp. PMI_491]